MINWVKKLFVGSKNKKLLDSFNPLVQRINGLENSLKQLSDADLVGKTQEFKMRISKGESLDDILPEAYAVVREASVRVLQQRHFDVQIIGGIALHQGMVTEMLTGEGKTLVSTLPAYLNALLGKGVHIITVNDYLAQRDSQWMGKIHEFLGLKVGVLTAGLENDKRKEAYEADITYGTNSEFGFDYLRDNMKIRKEDLVQRSHSYSIVDEVDSVLIDEARTPLIISGAAEDKTKYYANAKKLVVYFQKDDDFEIDLKGKSANLTEEGIEKLEGLMVKFGFMDKDNNLFDSENVQFYHFMTQALRAHYLFDKEVDYIVRGGEVVIIDEFTGRMMEGRRFSHGLHPALEAKEGLHIRNENQTLASITLQNYFRLYAKLSGMTGTAMTEAKEFLEIYGLEVISIPPNKPVTRQDHDDKIYLTYQEKEKAIVQQIEECHLVKRPVLVGTVSIEKSEKISIALTKLGISHQVLNAKQHENEAHIIAQAGQLGAVTIATNMAGRGTDIQLGGNLDFMLQDVKGEDKHSEAIKVNERIQQDKINILSLGGLLVVATERHESRRIDNQLRGRSGRQGEAGASIFYISLEDDLMKIFGSNTMDTALKKLGFKQDESISHPMISKAVERAQKKVEEHNFEIRKSLLRFDNVINDQRNIVYEQRHQLLSQDIDIMKFIESSTQDLITSEVSKHCPEKDYRDDWDVKGLHGVILGVFGLNIDINTLIEDESLDVDEIANLLIQDAKKHIFTKIDASSTDNIQYLLSAICLQLIDVLWKRHLLELDDVRSSITLRAYANKDPFNEYQKEAFTLFSYMIDSFKSQFLTIVSHAEFSRISQKVHGASNKEHEKEEAEIPIKDKVSRNDPCPCGSGKKYKHCHGRS